MNKRIQLRGKGRFTLLLTLLFFVLAVTGCMTAPPAKPARSDVGLEVKLRDETRLHYRKAGQGPALVLLHPMRMQAEYFDHVVPLLTRDFTVYSVDLPGHGRSSLPRGEATEPAFRQAVVELLVALDLREVTLAGESIGAILAVTVAKDAPDRVSRVVALNPYDYGEKFGGGIRRSKSGWIIGLFDVFGRHTIEPRFALEAVLRGGMLDESKLPEVLITALMESSRRRGFRKSEYSLFKNWRSWLEAGTSCGAARVPVTLAYSDHDWSRPVERQATARLLRLDQVDVIARSGHFACLEQPHLVAELILRRPSAKAGAFLRSLTEKIAFQSDLTGSSNPFKAIAN